MHKLLLALGTLDRPQMLSAALSSIRSLKIPESASLEVLVVDNSTEGNARSVVESFEKAFPVKLTYVMEPDRGLSPVRNRILHYGFAAAADYLFCMDDDMMATPDWLLNLYATCQDQQADAVAGRVIYHLPEDAPEWLTKRDFYGSYSRKTGAVQWTARTNNVMFDLHFAEMHNLSFHPELSDCGGEDTHFFHQFTACGGKIIWCDEAILHEEVPTSRASEGWILNRAYKIAVAKYTRRKINNGTAVSKIQTFIYGLGQLSLYLLNLPLFLFLPTQDRVYWKRKYAKFKGCMAGILGKTHDEYSVIHGR